VFWIFRVRLSIIRWNFFIFYEFILKIKKFWKNENKLFYFYTRLPLNLSTTLRISRSGYEQAWTLTLIPSRVLFRPLLLLAISMRRLIEVVSGAHDTKTISVLGTSHKLKWTSAITYRTSSFGSRSIKWLHCESDFLIKEKPVTNFAWLRV